MGVTITTLSKNPGDIGTAAYGYNGGLMRESVPRNGTLSAGGAPLSTGVMYSVGIQLYAGDVVNKLAFRTGTAGFTTITNHWFALYDDSATPALLAQTPDNGSTAWGATTARELTLASTVVVPRTGLYYASLCAVFTGTPNIVGVGSTSQATLAGMTVATQKALALTSGSSLTTTAPATIASPSTSAVLAYCTARA